MHLRFLKPLIIELTLPIEVDHGMTNLSAKQQIQEEQYEFPYHYIPQGPPNFTISETWVWGVHYLSTVEFLTDKLKKIDFNSLIDVGTGDGRLVKDLTKSFPESRILGIDYSAYAINLASVLNPTCEFKCTDIFADELKGQFECITLIEVFEHIPLDEAQKFADRLAELLKPGGHLIITVPHKNRPLLDKHYQHFDKESLYGYFKNHFNIQEAIHFHKRSWYTETLKFFLANPFFTLNHQGIKNFIYAEYKKRCFFSSVKRSGRVFMHLKKH